MISQWGVIREVYASELEGVPKDQLLEMPLFEYLLTSEC